MDSFFVLVNTSSEVRTEFMLCGRVGPRLSTAEYLPCLLIRIEPGIAIVAEWRMLAVVGNR